MAARNRKKKKSFVLALLGVLGLAGCGPVDNAASRANTASTSATGTNSTFPMNNTPSSATVTAIPAQHWALFKGNYRGTLFKAVMFENPESQAYAINVSEATLNDMKFGYLVLQSSGSIGNLTIEAYLAVAGNTVVGNVTTYTLVSNILHVAELTSSDFAIKLSLAVTTDSTGAHFNPTQSKIYIKDCGSGWSCPRTWSAANPGDFWLGDDFSKQ